MSVSNKEGETKKKKDDDSDEHEHDGSKTNVVFTMKHGRRYFGHVKSNLYIAAEEGDTDTTETSIVDGVDDCGDASEDRIVGLGDVENPLKATSSSSSSSTDPTSPSPPPPQQQHQQQPHDRTDIDGTSISPLICPICINEYDDGDEICWSQNPDCNHFFHCECISEWLLRHDECPCCRNNFLLVVSSSSSNKKQQQQQDQHQRPQEGQNNDYQLNHQRRDGISETNNPGRYTRSRNVMSGLPSFYNGTIPPAVAHGNNNDGNSSYNTSRSGPHVSSTAQIAVLIPAGNDEYDNESSNIPNNVEGHDERDRNEEEV